MSSELLLPATAMDTILSFLDPASLAAMAQTCNTWRRIVYRKSVWSERNITYKDHKVILHHVPPHARHIGSPTQICFLHWLDKQLSGIEHEIPVSIEHLTDPTKYMKAVFAHWKRRGSPCLIHDHHKLQDLFTIPLPPTLTKAEKQRILCRLITASDSPTHNPYCHYLERQNMNLVLHVPHYAPPGDALADTSNPLHKFMIAASTALRARTEAFHSVVRAVCAKNTACFTALARRGKVEFEVNDTWYMRERDAIWSNAGFSHTQM